MRKISAATKTTMTRLSLGESKAAEVDRAAPAKKARANASAAIVGFASAAVSQRALEMLLRSLKLALEEADQTENPASGAGLHQSAFGLGVAQETLRPVWGKAEIVANVAPQQLLVVRIEALAQAIAV